MNYKREDLLVKISRAQRKLLDTQEELLNISGEESTTLISAAKKLAEVSALVHPVGSSTGSSTSAVVECPHCAKDIKLRLSR